MHLSQIIWDPNALDEILLQLRRAGEMLTQCKQELQSVYIQGTALLQNKDGASQCYLSAIEYAMQCSQTISDRSALLQQAMCRVQEMILANETALQSLIQGKTEDTMRVDPSGSDVNRITTVLYTNTSERILGIVPQWLSDAANQAFP